MTAKLVRVDEAGIQPYSNVVVRVDYNSPQNNDGSPSDVSKIQASVDTINFLLGINCKVTLVTHLGRPSERPNDNLSLKLFIPTLEELLGKKVKFIPNCVGQECQETIRKLEYGQVVLLENCRFHDGEEQNDTHFGERIVGENFVYVNEAFSCSHREHSTIHKVPKIISSRGGICCAGFSFIREYHHLQQLMDPVLPFRLIVGGSKIKDKIGILTSLIESEKIDKVVITGAMANTFLASQGVGVEESLHEPKSFDLVDQVLSLAEKHNVKIVLPVDAKVLSTDGRVPTRPIYSIRKGEMIGDIGQKTRKLIAAELRGSSTIFWNGTTGITEDKVHGFDKGTNWLAGHLARMSGCHTLITIGGGDTGGAIPDKARKRIHYCSESGGAALDFLAKGTIPGIEVLLSSQIVAA